MCGLASEIQCLQKACQINLTYSSVAKLQQPNNASTYTAATKHYSNQTLQHPNTAATKHCSNQTHLRLCSVRRGGIVGSWSVGAILMTTDAAKNTVFAKGEKRFSGQGRDTHDTVGRDTRPTWALESVDIGLSFYLLALARLVANCSRTTSRA